MIMNENMTIDMERDQESGQITYANEVIATIVSVATSEVEGITGIAGSSSPLSGRMNKGKIPRGVRVDMNNGDVSVDVSVTVDYGMPIQKVGRSAQENVRKSIESMTGLHVDKVDLHVVGVSFEKENQEMLESQKLASMSRDDSVHDEADEQAQEEPVVVELVEEESVSAVKPEDDDQSEAE